MVGAHLKIYLFGSRLDRDHSFVGPSIEDEPNHLGTTLWAPTLSKITWAPPCGRPDCTGHVGATPWAPVFSQTLIHPKIA